MGQSILFPFFILVIINSIHITHGAPAAALYHQEYQAGASERQSGSYYFPQANTYQPPSGTYYHGAQSRPYGQTLQHTTSSTGHSSYQGRPYPSANPLAHSSAHSPYYSSSKPESHDSAHSQSFPHANSQYHGSENSRPYSPSANSESHTSANSRPYSPSTANSKSHTSTNSQSYSPSSSSSQSHASTDSQSYSSSSGNSQTHASASSPSYSSGYPHGDSGHQQSHSESPGFSQASTQDKDCVVACSDICGGEALWSSEKGTCECAIPPEKVILCASKIAKVSHDSGWPVKLEISPSVWLNQASSSAVSHASGDFRQALEYSSQERQSRCLGEWPRDRPLPPALIELLNRRPALRWPAISRTSTSMNGKQPSLLIPPPGQGSPMLRQENINNGTSPGGGSQDDDSDDSDSDDSDSDDSDSDSDSDDSDSDSDDSDSDSDESDSDDSDSDESDSDDSDSEDSDSDDSDEDSDDDSDDNETQSNTSESEDDSDDSEDDSDSQDNSDDSDEDDDDSDNDNDDDTDGEEDNNNDD
ncbi:dentin sialophosphoprotein-like [Ischnura elegans]|uniref:dentin sialophosphoprotein-like n=1 Tax=Ischnura elegans TaxID=197161 RepID=UPI001ED8A167|nr:dentin sialophosphoprotein-like [Ischnura elegans]